MSTQGGGPAGGESFTATVLFSDVVNSTGILQEHGEEGGRRLLLQCLEVMTRAVEAAGGRVMKRIGDEIFCLFDDADAAAHAASEMQQRVVTGHDKGTLGCEMRVRTGFEHGPVTRSEGELYGTTIHAAKRLVDLAKAGQILTSHATLDRLGPVRRRMARYFDSVVLKGIAEEQEVYELLWDTTATVVPTNAPRHRREKGILAVRLRYGDQEVRVDSARPRVTLGRDSACDLKLKGGAVSRVHARVTWNRGKVQVEDVSTNGTCIQTADGVAVTLHHDAGELAGSGRLRCGCLGREEDSALVSFACS